MPSKPEKKESETLQLPCLHNKQFYNPPKSLNLVEAAIQEFVAEMLEVDLQGC